MLTKIKKMEKEHDDWYQKLQSTHLQNNEERIQKIKKFD